MQPLRSILTLAITASVALAQTCLDPNYGTLLGTSIQDTVLPIQAIGFPFPLGGATYTDVHITDHGFVQLSNAGVPAPLTGGVLYTPSTANFALTTPKVAALYTDVIGTGGGTIYINSSATQCMVTWISMTTFGAPTTQPRFSFQMTLYPNGDVKIVYGPGCTNNSTFGGVSDNGIAGITPPTASLPAPVDLSIGGSQTTTSVYENWVTANTFDMQNTTLMMFATNPGYTYVTFSANCAQASNYGTGCNGLGLAAVGAPALGNSTFALNVTGVPAVSPIAFVAFGDQVVNPGLDLTFLGMPTCSGYTNLNLGMYGTGPIASGTGSFTLPIPNNPAIAGTVLSTQGISLSLSNPFGLNSSNGTRVLIGY
jgi:hypothetical protein